MTEHLKWDHATKELNFNVISLELILVAPCGYHIRQQDLAIRSCSPAAIGNDCQYCANS